MFFDKDYSAGRLLITGCNVADTRRLRVIRGVSVLLEGGKVSAVGDIDPAGIDSLVMPAKGCTVTPGLIDAHVHLCLSGQPNCHTGLDALSAEDRLNILRENLRLNLERGVTTVRDLGSRWEMLEQMRRLESTGTVCPTVFAAGPVCTVMDGHALFIGEAVLPGQIHDLLHRLKENGADFLKLIGTGGTLSPGTDCRDTQYTDDEFGRLVEAAHSAGFDVACHAHAVEGIEQCIRFGARSIEHGSYMTKDQADRLARTDGCYWVPTVCPGRLIPDLSEAAADRVTRRRENIRYCAERDVRIVAGTDAGIGGVRHGCLPHELDELMECGKTALEALQSATYLTAAMMRLNGRIGVVEAGASADILLYDGDIENRGFSFHDPAAVIKGGALLPACR